MRRKPKDWAADRPRPDRVLSDLGAARTPRKRKLVWVTAEGARRRARTRCEPGETVPRRPGLGDRRRRPSRSASSTCRRHVRALRASCSFPTDARLRKLTPRASRQIRPSNAQKPPAGHAARDAGPGRQDQARLLHRAREPHLRPDPRRRPARRRRPEARRCSARRSRRTRTRSPSASRCSTTSTRTPRPRSTATSGPRPRAVSDYVVEELAPELRRPQAALRLRRLLGHLARRGLPVRPGREAGHLLVQLRRGDRRRRAAARTTTARPRRPSRSSRSSQVRPRHDARVPAAVPRGRRHGAGCFPNDASSGGVDVVLSAGPGPTSRSTTRRCRSRRRPDAERRLDAQSRFDCFKQRFDQQLAAGRRARSSTTSRSPTTTPRAPRPGRRTPNAMIAENDWALGEIGRPDLELADLEGVADPRDRGRLAGRRRPRRRAPDPRVRDQPVRRSAARWSTRATTSSRSSARSRSRSG